MNFDTAIIETILENARWAPSGDNMQQWRFELINSNHFVIHGHDTRDHCVYDLQGYASQLAIGALLESISIAATSANCIAEFKLRDNMPETKPTIDVLLIQDDSIELDPLFKFLPQRSVQRRMLKTNPLTVEQKNTLELSVGEYYTVQWIEGWANRLKAAGLMFNNGKLRLSLPEAFATHSTIIEWNARFSEDKIPDQAVGLDPIATRMMRWALKSWQYVRILNAYFAGTLLPRIELDFLPSLFCGAHFALVAKQTPNTIQDNLNAGRAIQRFWLSAAQLGLQLQPEMTPLIFSKYLKNGVKFTQVESLTVFADRLAEKFTTLVSNNQVENLVFIGRIGFGNPAFSRSLRLPVKKLLIIRQD